MRLYSIIITVVCGSFHSGMCECMILALTWMSQVPHLCQGEQEEIMTMACITGALQVKGTAKAQFIEGALFL